MHGFHGLAAIVLVLSTAASAAEIAFVACPIVRDTDPPCWLARHDGKLYYLGIQQDTVPPVVFYPPQLGHKALIEATGVGSDEACGGIVLESARASVRPELDPSCNQILPAEGYEPPPGRRTSVPPPTGIRLATAPPGSREDRNGRGGRPGPSPPYTVEEFEIGFDFDDDFLYLEQAVVLRMAARYFLDTAGQRIDFTVARDRVRLTSGEMLEERPAIAALRRDRVHSILVDLGIPAEKIHASIAAYPRAADRRAVIEVTPCTADCPPPRVAEDELAAPPLGEATYSTYSSIGEILDDPKARAVLVSYWPNAAQRQIALARGMTLRGIAKYSQSGLTEALLDDIDHGLETMTPRTEPESRQP